MAPALAARRSYSALAPPRGARCRRARRADVALGIGAVCMQARKPEGGNEQREEAEQAGAERVRDDATNGEPSRRESPAPPHDHQRKFTAVPTRDVIFLVACTSVVSALIPLSMRVGAPLLGLGFNASSVNYLDSAPAVAVFFVFIVAAIAEPSLLWYLVALLGGSTALALFILYVVVPAEIPPTNTNAALVLGVPAVSYLTFFGIRAWRYHREERARARGEASDADRGNGGGGSGGKGGGTR